MQNDTESSGTPKKYIVLGIPQVPPGKESHPGGQLTAANGLVHHLKLNGIRFELLNTLASTYPPTPLSRKLSHSIRRIYRGYRHAGHPNCMGYLAFSNFRLSFYERCAISLVFRLYRKPSLIFFRSTEILQARMSKAKRKVLSVLLKIPSVIVSQGSLLGQELRRLGVANVEVIPNWLPPDCSVAQLPLQYPEDSVVNFAFIGWLERAKGVPEFLEAIKCLKPLSKRFRVYIAGNGTLEQYVADAISEEQLTNVQHLGWLDRDQVKSLLARTHVLVLPSHTEGFPNVLLEAMSYGLPVIATRVGAIPDAITQGQNGLLVNVSSPTEIAECMGRYINDTGLIAAHSISAIQMANNSFRSDVNCARLLYVFGTASAQR